MSMSFSVFKKEVKQIIEQSIRDNGFPEVSFTLEEPPTSNLGEMSTNIAFQLARKMKRNPMQVLHSLGEKISLIKGGLVASFTLDSPGYINFKLNFQVLALQLLPSIQEKNNLKTLNLGQSQKITVEHTSVNPNKALHIGHLRNVALGDSLARLLRYTHHSVQVLNYVDDSGSQVADLLVGFLHCNYPLEPLNNIKFAQYCGDTVYVQVNEMYSVKPELKEKQKVILQEIETAGSEKAKLAKKVTNRILSEQLKTCWRFGALYDCLVFESHILESRLWDKIFEELKKKEITHIMDEGKLKGCWIVEVEGEDEGEEKVLVRGTGTVTYIAKDIPFAAWKIGLFDDPFRYKEYDKQPNGSILWSTDVNNGQTEISFSGTDKVITVIDHRQARLQRIISSVLSRLRDIDLQNKYRHLGYAVVSLSTSTVKELDSNNEKRTFLHMSGRKGVYLNADNALDALKKRAFDETKKRNTAKDENWLNIIAEGIAVAALRFVLLKQDLDKIIVFDLDEVLRLDGETGPYVLYSYARSVRILEKSCEPIQKEVKITQNLEPQELKLLKDISKFDIVLEESVRNLSIKNLSRYALLLCSDFNQFYEKTPVLKSNDQSTRAFRLMLVRGFKVVLQEIMDILGLPILEQI